MYLKTLKDSVDDLQSNRLSYFNKTIQIEDPPSLSVFKWSWRCCGAYMYMYLAILVSSVEIYCLQIQH